MSTKINFSNLVRKLLPLHKRNVIQLWWLRGLVSPLTALFTSFDKWRSDTRMILDVNSQVAIFEGYLRKKYGQPITIQTFEDDALMVCLEGEGDIASLNIALDDTEITPAVNVPLDGEIREQFGDVDFIISLPAGVDIEMIRADIERFKIALVKYKIAA